MIIGVPKEIKQSENRVALTDHQVKTLVQKGHQVLVQKGAGLGSLIKDESYKASGAKVLTSMEEVYAQADMIIKVKEPLKPEYKLLKENQILYTFLHLAAEPELTEILIQRGVKAIAYETIQEEGGRLPLLTPMSVVAGRLAAQVGATCLQKDHGGRGILLGGVPGVFKARTVIIGGGTVGKNACAMALGLQSKVTVLDTNLKRLEEIDTQFGGRVQTLYSSQENREKMVKCADLLICAVLKTGGKAPRLISRKMIKGMQEGSVIVDVSIDQGGCVEGIRPTSHKTPTFIHEGVVHYAVPNIPGIVARTSTYALTNSTFPYTLMIAQKGLKQALTECKALKKGLNIYEGQVTHEAVARALNKNHVPFSV